MCQLDALNPGNGCKQTRELATAKQVKGYRALRRWRTEPRDGDRLSDRYIVARQPRGCDRPGGFGDHGKRAWKLNPIGARSHRQGAPRCLKSPGPQHFRHTRGEEDQGHPECFRVHSQHFCHTRECWQKLIGKAPGAHPGKDKRGHLPPFESWIWVEEGRNLEERRGVKWRRSEERKALLRAWTSSRNWEVMDDPRNENSVGSEQDLPQPEMQQGYILKKRKWPLKGWHKRYFILDKGILRYAKTQQDINKGKLHGSIDVSLSVMSINKKSKRIDLDAEDNLYHLKLQQGSAPNQSSCSVDMHIVDGKVSAWLQQTSDMQTCSIELSKCQADLNELSRLLQDLDMLHRVSSAPVICNNQNSSSDRPKKEKRTSKIWCAKNLTKEGTVAAMGNAGISSRWHASVPSLPDCLGSEQHPSAFTLPADFSQLQRDFCCLAQKVHTSLKSAFDSLSLEKERLQKIWQDPHLRPSPIMHTANFRNTLSEASPCGSGQVLKHQLSVGSSVSLSDSHAEYFDACEVILCGSSSENEGSDADSCASDITNSNSEEHLENFSKAPITCVTSALSSNSGNMPKSQEGPGRRTCLPAPGPNTSNISLWNIMRNNIGKDLSRVSMPVQLNEPMNTLQKLCEELEYSEVLDRANQTQDPFERMVYIAAFAISAYASAFHRSGSKPFNPVLGETYECERLDKGFRFGDHYEWNKVTSCIHNILSTQRWIEHYGEVIIRNTKSSICHCKITFCKSKYWSSNMNEVQGAVLDESGNVIHRLGGRWHEGLYCGSPPKTHCIWKPNAMPVDFDRYYGFTKFALELNEITPELKTLLPPTDTRLRPDQRYLEEGNLEAAETHKHRVEQLQRERRQVLEENGVLHQPRFFTRTVDASGKEIWFSNGTYWKQRKDPGFHKMDNAVLW
ncbi:OSBL7 protein, partial [Polypterus senegalus]